MTNQAEQDAIATYTALRQSLTLVEESMILLAGARERNPSPTELTDLDAHLLDLGEMRTRIDGKMTALLARRTVASMPSAEQIAEIARLTGEVERQTNSAAAVSEGLKLGADVLQFGKGLAFG